MPWAFWQDLVAVIATVAFPVGTLLLVMFLETLVLRRRYGPGFSVLLKVPSPQFEAHPLGLARGAATLACRLPAPLARRWAAALLTHGATLAYRARPRLCWILKDATSYEQSSNLLDPRIMGQAKTLRAMGLEWFDASGNVRWCLKLTGSAPEGESCLVGTYGKDQGQVYWDCRSGEITVRWPTRIVDTAQRSVVYGVLRFPEICHFLVFVYWWSVLLAAYPHLRDAEFTA